MRVIRRFAAVLAALAAAQSVLAQDSKEPAAEEISGFAFQRDDGLWLDDGSRPDPDDVATLLHLGPWNHIRRDTCLVRGPVFLDSLLQSGPPKDQTSWPFRIFREGVILSREVKK